MAKKEVMLQEAVEAGQSGDLARARELLLKLLETDNKEPLYWLLMSTCVDSKEERIYCLHNVLKLDPENSAAKHDLKLLAAPLPGEDPESLEDQLGEDWQTSEIAAPTNLDKKKIPREDPWPVSNIVGAIGLGIVVIFLGYYAVTSGLINLDPSTVPTPNSLPSILISNPTSTRVTSTSSSSSSSSAPTATQQASATATAEMLVIPRDPQDMLDATHTPTPLYVNTPHTLSDAFQDGLNAFHAGNWLEAISAMERHLSGEPATADAEYYIAESRMRLDDFDSARDAYSRAIALDQSFAAAYLGLAQASIALGVDDSSAITNLNSAILLDADFPEAFLTRAAYYLDQGESAPALEDLERAEALQPQSAQLHALKARAFSALGNYEFASLSAQQALDLDITLLPNYLVLANAALQLDLPDDAISVLQSYLSFISDDGLAWEFLGLAHEQNGHSDLAFEAFIHALDLDPFLAYASYYRGLAFQEENIHTAAVPLYRVTLNRVQDWFEPRVALAEALLLSGDPGAAFFEINASGALAISDQQLAQFHYWRASILESLGQSETALPDWRKLLTLPNDIVPEEWRILAAERTLAP